jgi:hypothetical protein
MIHRRRFKTSFVYFAPLLFNFLLILSFFNSAHAGGVLPDTGQTKCYNSSGEIPCPAPGEPFYGQDGNYQGFQPAYQVSAGGLVVTDLRTGLMWQQADDGVGRDRAGASAYCGNLILEGQSDWRMPSRLELLSIVDYGRSYPAINPVFRCLDFVYWSGTTWSYNPVYAWVVDFNTGYSNTRIDGPGPRVRCVRGGP